MALSGRSPSSAAKSLLAKPGTRRTAASNSYNHRNWYLPQARNTGGCSRRRAAVEPGGFTDNSRRLSSAKPPVTPRNIDQAPRRGARPTLPWPLRMIRNLRSTGCDALRSTLVPFWHPFLGPINFCSNTGGLHCVPTSGCFLATLRVAVAACLAHVGGYWRPIATSFSVVRKNSVPSEMAGVDKQIPPSVLVASTLNCSLAGKTKTSPRSPVR